MRTRPCWKTDQNRLSYGDTFTIIVGPEKISHAVHQQALVRSSGFFRAACNGNFKEAEEKTIRLPEMDKEAFKSYVQWAYTNEVAVKADDDPGDDAEQEARWNSLARLYGATHILLDIALRNAIIDRLILLHGNRTPNVRMVNAIYKLTTADCKLRALVTDRWAAVGRFDTEKGRLVKFEDFNHEFLVDFMRATLDIGQTSIRPAWESRCHWHEHNEEVPVCEGPEV